MIARIMAIVKNVLEKKNTIFLQCSSTNDIVKDIEMLHPSGMFSKPHKNKKCLVLNLNQNRSVVIGFADTNTSLNIKDGEMVIYSTDKHGLIKAKIHLANDGKILLDTKNNITIKSKKIELNGNTKNFVTYAALDAALKKFTTTLNLHTHGSSMGPTTSPAVTMSINIAASKTTTVVTGG